MTGLTAEDLWVQWWCNPWRWAHPGWQSRFAEPQGLSVQACDTLMGSRHNAFLQSAGIAPSQPPEPVKPVLRWIAMDPSQQQRALALAQLICFAQTETAGPDGQWCWALTKALRPGVWLDCDRCDARPLLGAWLGPEFWSRLRLAWPPGEVADDPCQAPDNKLQTLWQAIMWRVTAN